MAPTVATSTLLLLAVVLAHQSSQSAASGKLCMCAENCYAQQQPQKRDRRCTSVGMRKKEKEKEFQREKNTQHTTQTSVPCKVWSRTTPGTTKSTRERLRFCRQDKEQAMRETKEGLHFLLLFFFFFLFLPLSPAEKRPGSGDARRPRSLPRHGRDSCPFQP